MSSECSVSEVAAHLQLKAATLWHDEARPPFNKSMPTLPNGSGEDDSTGLEQHH